MSERYDVDEVLKNPYTFMNEVERDFFERFGDAIEQQADLIAEQHGVEADEQRGDLDKLLQGLEKEDDEYVVAGALLNCSKGTYNRQILMYKGKEIESRPIQADTRVRIQVPETREAQINGYIPATVEDCKGGIRDISKGDINIFGFGNCCEITGKVALEDLLAKAGLLEKKKKSGKLLRKEKVHAIAS